MFDPKFAYKISTPIEKKGPSSDGELHSHKYKFKTLSKKTYFVKVCVYKHNIHFIKFYPSRLELSPNKYKKRIGNVKEFSRIVSTCLKLAVEIIDKKPDAIFGFFGQWDDKDVEEKAKVSQRYRIYSRAIVSNLENVTRHKFNYFKLPAINTFFFVPESIDFKGQEGQLTAYFANILGEEGLNELFIPEKQEQ
jgi:hypothetical protein